jgi:methionyl-tRNA formyltransferase
MRVLLLGNGMVAARIAERVRAAGDEIVGLVRHPPERSRNADELERAAGVDRARMLDGARLREPDSIKALGALGAEIGVAAGFGYRVPCTLLEALVRGCVNVHPAWLPFNRGAYPNVWSILDGTPAGVTVHWMDENIDTGPVIAQRRVVVEPVDTGASLHAKLETTAAELFAETWPAIRAGTAVSHVQDPAEGTTHRVRDVDAVDEVDLDRAYPARQLIDLLRARTFPPHRGAWFRDGDRRVYLRLELDYDRPGEGP